MPEDLTILNPVRGFGYLSNISSELVEWYLIFADGERSECKTNHRLLDFSETTLPEASTPSTLVIVYHSEDSKLMGIQLLGPQEEILL